jgi:hypothetical protein
MFDGVVRLNVDSVLAGAAGWETLRTAPITASS